MTPDLEALIVEHGIYFLRIDLMPAGVKTGRWSYEWESDAGGGYGRVDSLDDVAKAIVDELGMVG